MRWGPGPVFLYECLANSRRWQTYAIRSVGVAVMLAAVSSIAMSRTTVHSPHSWRDYAALGESYFTAIIGVELTLVMLAAPAATAGAICVDRARGTLTHMLVTDLSDPEIVLGKLAARLLPILGLVACTWPVLAISSLLGGIDPTALTLAFAIILAVAVLGCTMALALSVWARKPHEVVLVVYTFWMLMVLLWPIWSVLSTVTAVVRPPAWSLAANPYYLAFAPYSTPGRVGFWDYLGFFAVVLGASAVLTVLAVWRMRPVARRGTVERRQEPTARPDRPDDAMAARPVARPQSRALARVASVAAVALADDPGRAIGRLDRRLLHRRRRHALEDRVGPRSARSGGGPGDVRPRAPGDLRPADAIGLGADVDVGGAAAGQPRPPGRDHALDAGDRARQVAGDAPAGRAAGDRAGIGGIRDGHGLHRPPAATSAGVGPADRVPGRMVAGRAALRGRSPGRDGPRPRCAARERRRGDGDLDRPPGSGDRHERRIRRDAGCRLADARGGQPHGPGRTGHGLPEPGRGRRAARRESEDAFLAVPARSSGGPRSGTSSAWRWPWGCCG